MTGVQTCALPIWEQKNLINSLYIVPENNEVHNRELEVKFKTIEENEQRWEEYLVDDAKLVLVAFGTAARICKAVVDRAREEGLAVGLIRPITLWPFPAQALDRLAATADMFMSVEMSLGQMIEDVRLVLNGRRPVYFHGRVGGMLPVAGEVLADVKKIMGGGAT